MSTWTLHQIGQVRGLWAQADVDVELLMKHEVEVAAATRAELFDQLRHHAHPLAVELHIDDMELLRKDFAEKPWLVTFQARWNPSTNAVEMRGGPIDGAVYTVQKVGEPIKVPTLNAARPWLHDDAAPATITSNTVLYEYTGWNEAERRWVYSA